LVHDNPKEAREKKDFKINYGKKTNKTVLVERTRNAKP
jgi:hypothetical protein